MHPITFTIAALCSTFGYVVYMYLGSSEKLKQYISPNDENNTGHILFQRLAGAFIFGIIPIIFISSTCECNMSNFGITWVISTESILWIIGLSFLIIPLNFFNSKKPDNLAMYPQIRKQEWSTGLVIASALSWVTYLLAYEMLFRGFLLFSSLELIGYWPAILLNTGIYSLAHYPKGNKETFGSIPLGLILCILTLKTGTIWIAFITHVVLALSNEWFSLKLHDSINFKKVVK